MARTGRPRKFDRDAALRAAMLLFWEFGYESTSLAQLKQAMGGISAASLYTAFGSKEALFIETTQLYLSTVGNQLRNILSDPKFTPQQAIECALHTAVDKQCDSTFPPGCMLVLSATNCSPQNRHLHDLMAKERAASRQAFRDCIQRGIDNGSLKPDTDADALAVFFSTLLNGFSIQARDDLSATTLKQAVDVALKHVDDYAV